MALSAGLRVRLSPDALSQDLGDELFILDLRRQRYYSLDAVGARMWTLLGEHAEVARTVREILAEYDVDIDTAETDIMNLITRLAAAGLLTLTS